jgi:hypothetical protein
MGNTLSDNDINQIKHNIQNIINYNCNILDIGNKTGRTGYIDFIEPEDIGSNDVMKGIDINGRKFIVFKAEYIFSNGKKTETFSTIFQRYSDSENTWQCCGHFGLNIMSTEGGMNLDQFDFLDELLYSKNIDINSEIINRCGLKIPYFHDMSSEPIKLSLGWSE